MILFTTQGILCKFCFTEEKLWPLSFEMNAKGGHLLCSHCFTFVVADNIIIAVVFIILLGLIDDNAFHKYVVDCIMSQLPVAHDICDK